jgi:hypothetical protein
VLPPRLLSGTEKLTRTSRAQDEIDQVTTVRMDGEIPRGLTGQARLDAERHVRETMMKYLVRWRRHVNENGTGSEEGDELKQQQSLVPNLVLKERAPKAIIRFFEVRSFGSLDSLA